MGKLIYAAITSLDGYIADARGKFDWSMPDEEVHAAVNDLERGISTYLYGRRLYEVMRVWDGPEMLTDDSPAVRDFATLWQGADKVVYSRTLPSVTTRRTRLERSFDSDAIRQMKQSEARDISVGGAGLAAEAFRAGLVDECHLYVSPVSVGGGTAALPLDVQVRFELLDQRRFGNGVVQLHYRVR